MSAVPLPSAPQPGQRCAVRGCESTDVVGHHADYKVPEAWAKIPLCPFHHEMVHNVHERVKGEGVTLQMVTLQFVLDPRKIARWTLRYEEPQPAKTVRREMTVRQLSFADLHGREGDYWRRMMRG